MKKQLLLITLMLLVTLVWAGKPSNPIVSQTTVNSATLTWQNGTCGIVDYHLQYKDVSTPSWITIPVLNSSGTTTYNLTGLSPNTTYEWKVRCGGAWRLGSNFITQSTSCNISSTLNITDASCNNTLNGYADLTVSGGTAPYSYSWDSGSNTEDLVAVGYGTYIVTITDISGCTLNDTANINFVGNKSVSHTISNFSPNPLDGYNIFSHDTLTITNTGCDVNIRPEFIISHQNSSIQQGDFEIHWLNLILGGYVNIPYIIVNGKAYGYWSLFSNPQDSTGINLSFSSTQQVLIRVRFNSPANYGMYTAAWETFEVDSVGNTLQSLSAPDSVSLTLVNCSIFSIDSTISTAISCNGVNDGTASVVSIINGSGNYSYLWSSAAATSAISNLSAGTYSVVVTDNSYGCTDSTSIIITEPAILSHTFSSSDNNSCGNCNGNIAVNLSGGTLPYSYNWNTGDSASSIQNACGGIYILTSSDANTCTTFIDTLIIIDTTTTSFSITTTSSNASCAGLSDGSASTTISGSGGSGGGSSGNYCSSGPTQNFYTNIELVRLIGDTDSISNNTSGACDTYEDYTSMSTSITAGQSYSMQVNIGFGGCSSSFTLNDVAKVFIDWNMDDDFNDTGEEVNLIGPTLSPSSNSFTLNVPASVVSGTTRMRVVAQCYSYNGNSTTFNACDNSQFFGATEDYTIIIAPPAIPASYLWSNGDTTAQISNLSSGTYSVTVTDTNNCSVTDSITITEPSAISASATTTNVSCNGGNDGTATLTLSGGTGTLTADWGIVNPNALSAGTHTYTITDSNSCTYTDSIIIAEPTAISASSATTDVNCNGASNGTATLTLSGGTGTLTADWGIVNPIALSAGTHAFTVSDSNSCTLTDSVTITEPTAIVASSATTNVSCNGGNDGTATLTLSGGTGSLSADWGTTNPASLSVGTYSFTVTDSNSCTYIGSVTISEPLTIAATPNITNVSCFGGSDGMVAMSLSGGTGTLSVSWVNGNPNAFAAGTYSFTITDINTCSLTDSVTITQPSAIVVSAATTNVLCNGDSTGTTALTLSGGTGTLTADWGLLNPTALVAGTHTYTITDSNNCSLIDSISISEPAAITSSFTTIDVDCYGNNTGSATVIFNGGVIGSAPGDTNYILSWDTLLYILPFPLTYFTTPIGVPEGIYPYGVTDANGCTHFDTITIYQPSQLSYSYIQTNVTACGLTDGFINTSILGGIQPYTFTWSSGDTTEDISNLSAGQYTLIVTDSNNCSIFDTLIITQPSNNLLVSATTSNYNNYQISCNGGTDSISSTTSGGTPGYTYLWSDGQITPTAYNLSAGNYTLTVTDTNSCDYTISVILDEPILLNNNIVSTNVLCNGSSDGSISVNVSGGVPNYNTNWGGISNPNILSISTYIITTTDSNNCIASDTILITQPDLLSGSIMITSNYNGEDVSCNGSGDGSAMASMLGGTPPYNYLWSSGGTAYMEDSLAAGTYSLIITDSNNCVTTLNATLSQPNALQLNLTASNGSCNGSCDGLISASISGGTPTYAYNWSNNDNAPITDSLCTGTYNLVIFDANGCLISDSAIINQPSILTITSDSITNVSYFGTNTGFIYASVAGGNGGYSYSWTGPNGFSSVIEDLDSLFIGTYLLTTTDSLGCSTTMQFIVDGPAGYPLIVQSDSVVNVSCNGLCDGVISIVAEGGDSSYIYAWTSSNGFTSSLQNISNLCPGVYDLQLSDSSGNIFNTSYQISEPNTLSISITTDSASCFGSTGLATVYPIGGTPSYTYLWSSGELNQSASLLAGMYTVLVSDTNNCTISDTLVIGQADSMVVNTSTTNATCFGLNNASISINITAGGQAPFSYSNDNGVTFQTVNTFFNLATGTYTMLIMDNNNCIASAWDSVSQPQELVFTIFSTDATCYGYCDATATLNISGGTPFYTEDWGGLNQMALCEGLVNISVTDSNGCIATNSVTINEPVPLIVNISQNGNILDAGAGFATYQWLDDNLNPINGATSQQFTPPTTGEYSVLVTDANGCSATSFSIMFIADGITELNTILNIYPNPTKDKLNIQYQGFEISSLLILDVSGNIVFQKNDIKPNENNLQLSLNQLPKGMYILQLISEEKIINHSVILQ